MGTISERDVRELIVKPWVMIASDGGYFLSGGHPRSFGTFPRVLAHYSRDLKLLTLEEAIRKMTSLPADHMRLYDRGRIAAGYVADITIFDPKTVADRATYVQPNALSVGIEHVIVNGRPALLDGKAVSAHGRFIARQSNRPVATATR